jgi:hypothetical protein
VLLGFVEQYLGRSFSDLSDAIIASSSDPNLSIFHLMRHLNECIWQEKDEIVPAAFQLLDICCAYTRVLQEVPDVRVALSHGGAEAMSLRYWQDISERIRHLHSRDILLFVLETLILSQHFAVATRRYDGGVVRLRITIEEEGLRALVTKPWKPSPALDKLASGLSLMADWCADQEVVKYVSALTLKSRMKRGQKPFEDGTTAVRSA